MLPSITVVLEGLPVHRQACAAKQASKCDSCCGAQVTLCLRASGSIWKAQQWPSGRPLDGLYLPTRQWRSMSACSMLLWRPRHALCFAA